MKVCPDNYSILIRRLVYLLAIYFICRLAFLVFNFSILSSSGSTAIALSFFFGLRYDITAIVISNIVFIILHLIPFSFFYRKDYQSVLKALFLIVNIPLILLNCIDFGLYPFTGKRSGVEIFKIMSFGNDLINTLPKLIFDFWYLLLLFFLLIYALIKIYPKLKTTGKEPGSLTPLIFIRKLLLIILFSALTFIGFRGGIQYKPLNVLSASRFGTGNIAALILNTPFTVIKTYGKKTIEEILWMSPLEAERMNPVIKLPDTAGFRNRNVILIILEGIGKEYIGRLNSYDGYTPFLDSLMNHSLVFANAYANGKRSIEGVPAIIAGIPALMSDPFISSAYSNNLVTSISSLLKLKGYQSVFFHGGTNGTMNFDNFSKLSGYDKYFGRLEYGNDDDYDGNWGIYDEPFLQRSLLEINKMKKPFFATIFTLSSHHPYKIPDKYEKRLEPGTLPIHKAVRYADLSLRKFFEQASAMPWFDSTLFVITCDHTSLSDKSFYQSRVGMYSIPVLYYSSSDSTLKGLNELATQQIDILPSIMDYLNFDLPYFAFGKSVFDQGNPGYAINYMDETYQLIHGYYSLIHRNSEKNSLYNFKVDSLLKNDIAGKDTLMESFLDVNLKSFLQNFSEAMIHNRMK